MFVVSGTCRALKQIVERTKFKSYNSTAIMFFHLASNYSLNGYSFYSNFFRAASTTQASSSLQ